MHRKHKAYVASAAAVALMIGGPAAAAVAAAHTADAAGTAPVSAAARADVDAEGAAAAALKKYPGVVESVDRDDAVWHVDVIGKKGKHAELTVDSRSGKVFTENADDHSDDGGNKALVAAKVTAQKAIKAALAAHSGQVWSVQWDDDDDNGARYWDVEVKNGDKTTHVHVDPASGKASVSGSDSDGDNDNDND
ncbi:PepSY domain-containing protein [Streptomyces sp. NPDC044571]|uniref:PepSY domain-containing protein n=1 Tax=Streptomyces sp. NPDC044571 TaxID=3155371 RepID=UPI0033DA9DDF